MKITIHLEIDEQYIAEICEIHKITRERFENMVRNNFEIDIGGTIQDNEEMFTKKSIEIE